MFKPEQAFHLIGDGLLTAAFSTRVGELGVFRIVEGACGERQRIGLARGPCNADCAFLDEPTSDGVRCPE